MTFNERIPADIRAAGGVSRMSDPKMIRGIQNAVSIPVMAKVRIGHFVEAQILQALEIDYIDESEVLSPADGVYHIDKTKFRVPFVCGAKDLGDEPRRFLQTMDIRVLRNAYGRQLGSFFTRGTFAGMEDVPMTFIRAPYVEQVTAPDVEVLATVDGHIVAARQRNMLATSFHPELNDDPRIHRWFLEHLVGA